MLVQPLPTCQYCSVIQLSPRKPESILIGCVCDAVIILMLFVVYCDNDNDDTMMTLMKRRL